MATEAPPTPAPAPTPTPAPPAPTLDKLPPFKLLLHNDDHNAMDFVVETIVELTPLRRLDAVRAMFEAHRTGASLLLTTHRERGELYVQQFASKRLIATLEPA
jgi:ATP-dependent Clp protease adaptor protein ClpS